MPSTPSPPLPLAALRPFLSSNRARLQSSLRLAVALLSLAAFFAAPILAQSADQDPVAGPAPQGAADPAAIVISGQARFTALTSRLIRMEWSANSQFEDHPSLVFINRRMPVPKFTKMIRRGSLIIQTGDLKLTYKINSGAFNSGNLSIAFTLNGKSVVWSPGMPGPGNLGGTRRTLDGANGPVPLDGGLLSRDGWVVEDDSGSPVFNENVDAPDWAWAIARPPGDHMDYYFFGYGHDYKAELHDFIRVAGRIPLPPRFVFGTWWSRYWAYTDEEFEQLIDQFHSHNVPLDVLVVDMDWHPTFAVRWWENKVDPSGHTLGWTGYSWNGLYFPEPQEFLSWVHHQDLKVTLNMHPASGVQPFETAYPEMARAMGIDPTTKQYIPFDIANKKFATNYMDILHHSLEAQGVDFFWLDWQQEGTTSLPGLNPTWWLNYVHFTDMEREGKRPLLFHRWGGLGNHRYEIGFSGDVISTWQSLAFQPYFTATAANVGYGYWSHDIGGHIPGTVEPELYTRWVQWGAFSPVLRTHTTKNPDSERRIWAFPAKYAEAMRSAFLLRYSLVPYIYTAARDTYDTGISILHPLYYDFPEQDGAYDHNGGYAFGSSMIAAPVVTPADPNSHLAIRSIWLPPGEWIEWPTGAHFTGPVQLTRTFDLDQIPVYVRPGSIIPMAPRMNSTDARPLDPLVLQVFPAKTGEGKLYEDAGNTLGYESGEFAWTHFHQQTLADGSQEIKILPTQGKFGGMLNERRYQIRVSGVWPPSSVSYNGHPIKFVAALDPSHPENAPAAQDLVLEAGWHYDGDTATLIVNLPVSSLSGAEDLVIKYPDRGADSATLLEDLPGHITRLRDAMQILETTWPNGWAPDILLDAAQAGHRVTLKPETAFDEYQKLVREWPDIVKAVNSMDLRDRAPIDAALANLADVSH
jgi:alpha-glucosidase (family GH31 glycosyl hydrolase)